MLHETDQQYDFGHSLETLETTLRLKFQVGKHLNTGSTADDYKRERRKKEEAS